MADYGESRPRLKPGDAEYQEKVADLKRQNMLKMPIKGSSVVGTQLRHSKEEIQRNVQGLNEVIEKLNNPDKK